MEPDPNIIAIFGPPPDGLDISESSVVRNNATVIILAVLASVAVVLRLMARFLQGHSLKADDWTILLSLLLVGATVGLSIAGGAYGAGNHVWSFTPPDLTQILYAYTFIYGTACAATKISILLFYQRIFLLSTASSQSFKFSLVAGYVLSVAYPIIIWATMANACRPLSFYWNQFVGEQGKCININTFYLALAIINMVNDVIVLLIPIPQILNLQMSGRKKAAVCSIMLLGSFVCVASIVRITHLSTFSRALDITWQMGPVFIWSAIEPSIAIVSACLPHLAPLRRLVRHKISSSLGHSSGNAGGGAPSSNSAPWRLKSKQSAGGGKNSSSQNGTGALFTYGGSRFNFGGGAGDGNLGGESDDEIGLTNRITAGSGGAKNLSTESGSEENINGGSIVVQSSFIQESMRNPR
ncbi:Pth11-like integral membrane protein [Colletotrichum scovillei]|uniref:Pth11-like integral membrane protein n=1 Tax=Colletotrichum scovillei TaxID=1209932 RepID=A0A9P7R644_9PEZI|nr:Pth11-like integral membrane protein [Colletotrichum scovillei]KAG7069933.1 Pth11-like integral membrane protein [Colletotrichum scovillei]KAG7078181.1 Pth11-like integral membrane protein [Colletotrichum scovillei]